MATILDKIYADKKEELAGTRRERPLAEMKQRARDRGGLRDAKAALKDGGAPRIIAEIKRRSPFKGELLADFDAVGIARQYAENGAAAISILTESRHFAGDLDYLDRVRDAVDIPLLRKDFIFDPYQVYEARAFGADFFLLIATWLDRNQLADLLALGVEVGLPALVETHDEADLDKAFHAGGEILGINNRDLKTGKTDLAVSRRLIGLAREETGKIVVTESGIHSAQDIEELSGLGADAFLIGESLMTSGDIPGKLKSLLGREADDDG